MCRKTPAAIYQKSRFVKIFSLSARRGSAPVPIDPSAACYFSLDHKLYPWQVLRRKFLIRLWARSFYIRDMSLLIFYLVINIELIGRVT